jgi:hypothetical protein
MGVPTARGRRRRELTDEYGFPRKERGVFSKQRVIHGFTTRVRARGEVTSGENKRFRFGRVTGRSVPHQDGAGQEGKILVGEVPAILVFGPGGHSGAARNLLIYG